MELQEAVVVSMKELLQLTILLQQPEVVLPIMVQLIREMVGIPYFF